MQICKKRQIGQIYLCYFFGAGANFWAMHARTSAISTSGISISAIRTNAIITSGISISAIYFYMMFLGAIKLIVWLSTLIRRFIMVLLVIYAFLSQIR